MELLTEQQELLLRANCKESRDVLNGHCGRQDYDIPPVVKVTYSNRIFLLSELDDDDMFFGLLDHGNGELAYGNVMLAEIKTLKTEQSTFRCTDIAAFHSPLKDYYWTAYVYLRYA